MRACVFLQPPVWRDLEVEGGRGVAQSSLSLFDNEDRTQLRRIGSCWPVGEGSLNSLYALVGASMTRPSRKISQHHPSHQPARPELQCPATRYRHSGCWIPPAHARVRDKDQPEGPVTSDPTHHPSTWDLQLQPGARPCKHSLNSLIPCNGSIGDSRYLAVTRLHRCTVESEPTWLGI